MTYYPALGTMIRTEMDRKDLSASFLGRRLYEHLNFNSPEAARLYICWVRKGSIYGSSSAKARQNHRNVERLAILLYAVGFAEDHRLIQALRQENARFVYPPLLGVSYEIVQGERDTSLRLEDRVSV